MLATTVETVESQMDLLRGTAVSGSLVSDEEDLDGEISQACEWDLAVVVVC